MPTTKNIERQMVSVGDRISKKTPHLASPGIEFQVKPSNGYHVDILIDGVNSNSDIIENVKKSITPFSYL